MVTNEKLEKIVYEQSILNDTFLQQNCVGRWLWKSGKLKSGHGVPWNIQMTNTAPDNFRWERDKVNIKVTRGGLYEVCFGFYSKKKPTVQLHVNGEAVLSAVNSVSYTVHHHGRYSTSCSTPSSGTITGLTLIDFIALPENAKVAISYSGEGNAEGFLSLRRLTCDPQIHHHEKNEL